MRSNQNSESVGPIVGTFADSNANILNDTDAQNSIVMDMNAPLLDDSMMGRSQRIEMEQNRESD